MDIRTSMSKDIHWATVLYTRKGGTTGIWLGVFAWNHNTETVGELQSRTNEVGVAQLWTYDRLGYPGGSYNNFIKLFNYTLLDIPEEFDLPALIDANDAVVYDCSNKPIVSCSHPLISGEPIVRPSEGKVSDVGRWLSQAHKYTNGPEGETEGPSGLGFL